jgi:hypothetical protein
MYLAVMAEQEFLLAVLALHKMLPMAEVAVVAVAVFLQ